MIMICENAVVAGKDSSEDGTTSLPSVSVVVIISAELAESMIPGTSL